METQELHRLVREQYPFPIAHAYKKVLGSVEQDMQKLKCLVEAAEGVVQFLALIALAQVRRDLLAGNLPNPESLAKAISLTRLPFGKWGALTPNVMEAYRETQAQLFVPELFDFCFRKSVGGKLRPQPLHAKVIDPLIALRNDFHHPGIPKRKIPESIDKGLEWLHQLIAAVQFLAQYQLAFTQKTVYARGTKHVPYYIHELLVFQGCYSHFDENRWNSGEPLEPDTVVLLGNNAALSLEPFIIFSEELKDTPDVYLLMNYEKGKPYYLSTKFGEILPPRDSNWADWEEGRPYQHMIRDFLRRLRRLTPEEEPGSAGVSPASDSPLEGGRGVLFPARPLSDREGLGVGSFLSIAEVFQQKYREPEPPVQHTSPYKFLDYYNPEDHDIFFGRDKEIRNLQQKFYTSRLLVLHGESGTGKTSLIRAGLIPRLDPESYVPVYVRMLQEPLREIKRELTRQLGINAEQYSPLEGGRGVFFPSREGSGVGKSPLEGGQGGVIPLAEFLLHVTERVSKTVVIVLDQFEEFFLRFPEEIRAHFTKEFAACVNTPRLDVKFLISLRADYFSYLAAFEDSIPQIFTHQLQLERLSETQALEAVIKPAGRLGIQVDEAMVRIKLLPELLAEDGSPLPRQEAGVAPPLLQIVCDALYQHAHSEGRQEIGMPDYEAIGDVKGCLGCYLDNKLRQFGAKQPIARAVLKALVSAEGTKRASFEEELLSRMQSMSPGSAGASPASDSPLERGRGVFPESTPGSAGAPPASDSPLEGGRGVFPGSADILSATDAGETPALPGETLTHDYLDKFVRDRLLRVEDVEGQPRYELSHEYLVAHIEAWIEESEREVTKVLEMIDRAYETYRSTGLPLGAKGLEMIKPFEAQLVLPRNKQAFVDDSKTHVKKERRELLMKVGVVLLVVALVVGGIFGYRLYKANQNLKVQKEEAETAWQEAEKKQKEAEINEIEALTQTSKVLFLSHDELNALLAIMKAGIKIKQTNLPSTLKDRTIVNLRRTLNSIHEKNRLEKHKPSLITRVAFSPDGKLLASISGDYPITLWNISEGKESIILRGYIYGVNTVAFSPNGALLASGSWENAVILWDIANQKLLTFKRYHRQIGSVAFSPDGTMLAGNLGGTIKLWNVPGLKEFVTLDGHPENVTSVAFSPDGALLASGSLDKTIKLWNVVEHTELVTLKGHSDNVTSVAFSSNGTLLASSSNDNTIKLWKVAEHTELVTLKGHSDNVTCVAFSSDDTLLASGSADKTINLWQTADILDQVANKKLVTSHKHANSIERYAFSPVSTFRGHADSVEDIAFSPDGTLIASAGGDKDDTIRIWATSKGLTTIPEGVTTDSSLDQKSIDDTINFGNLKLDDLLVQGCEWLYGYLKNNPHVSKEDRSLCDEILDNEPHEKRSFRHAQQRFNALMNWGNIYTYQSNYSEAIKSYRKALEITPNNEGVWRKMMYTLCQQGKIDDVLAALSEFALEHKTVLEFMMSIGEDLKNQDRIDGAITAYQTIIKTMPDHEGVWYQLGIAFLSQNKLDEAIIAFEKSLELTPDYEDAWYQLGLAFLSQNKLDEAIIALEKLLELTPDHEDAWYQLGLAFLRQGKFDKVITACQKFISISSPFLQMKMSKIWQIADEIKIQNKLDEASVLYRMVLVVSVDENLYYFGYDRGLILWEQGKLDEAMNIWDETATAYANKLKEYPNVELLLGWDARLALAQGDIPRCQARIAAATDLYDQGQYFVLLRFFAWLASPEQGWKPVMSAISELKLEDEFYRVTDFPELWHFSSYDPIITRQDKDTQQIAQDFINFFKTESEGKITFDTLKARLAEYESSFHFPNPHY